METVSERSRKTFVASFRDDGGALTTPSSVRYRVHDEESNTELVAWTSIAPDSRVTISIPASANRILTDANNREIKVLTVQSDQGTDNQQSQQYRYQVMNLSGFTS